VRCRGEVPLKKSSVEERIWGRLRRMRVKLKQREKK
jgi:hypothetical protein